MQITPVRGNRRGLRKKDPQDVSFLVEVLGTAKMLSGVSQNDMMVTKDRTEGH